MSYPKCYRKIGRKDIDRTFGKSVWPEYTKFILEYQEDKDGNKSFLLKAVVSPGEFIHLKTLTNKITIGELTGR